MAKAKQTIARYRVVMHRQRNAKHGSAVAVSGEVVPCTGKVWHGDAKLRPCVAMRSGAKA